MRPNELRERVRDARTLPEDLDPASTTEVILFDSKSDRITEKEIDAETIIGKCKVSLIKRTCSSWPKEGAVRTQFYGPAYCIILRLQPLEIQCMLCKQRMPSNVENACALKAKIT